MKKSKHVKELSVPLDDIPPVAEYRGAADKMIVESEVTFPFLVRKLLEAVNADEVTVEYEGGVEIRKRVRTDWRTRMEALRQCFALIRSSNFSIDAEAYDIQEDEALEEASKFYAVKLLESNGLAGAEVLGQKTQNDDSAKPQ